jgi:hypothetical protein
MIKNQIQADTISAQKAGNAMVLGTLRMLLAAVALKEKDIRYKLSLEKEPELADEQIIEVLTSEIKKRKDAIVLYEQGNRPELAEKEKKEIEALKKYLPEQLSPEELKKIVEESVNKVGAEEIKDMGKVMADLNPKIKGKADGGEVSKIVKEFLTKK